MISMPKEQIAIYLYDYQALIKMMQEAQNSEPFKLFQAHLILENRAKDATEEYYIKMLNIAYIFTKMKIFSIAEDYTLKQQNNFINDKDLDLSFLDSQITGDRSQWSKKKILQKLRDGFNHTSTTNNALYEISKSSKYMEFSFKEPTPIKIRLSIDDIAQLTSSIGESAKTFQFFSMDQQEAHSLKEYIHNLKIKRYYFPKKVEQSTISSVLKLEKEKKYETAMAEVKTIERVQEKDINLTKEQENRILMTIELLLKHNLITLEELQDNLKEIVFTLVSKELPIPIFKIDNLTIDSFIIHKLLVCKNISYSQIWFLFVNGLNNDQTNKLKDFFNKDRGLVFKTYYSNDYEKIAYSTLLFVEYILSNFKPEETFIKIGHRTVEYRHLRNAIVHGRWHVERNKILFYDTPPNVEKELDYYWSVKIDLDELHNYCFSILKSKQEKPKQKIKSILEI